MRAGQSHSPETKAKLSEKAKRQHAARRAQDALAGATPAPAQDRQVGPDTNTPPPGSGTDLPLISVTGPSADYGGDDLGPPIHPMVEVGVSGIAQYAGRIYDEFLKQLQGDKAIRTYREMSENDSTISAMLFAIEMFARQVDWRVEGDQKQADFVWGALHDMSLSWPDTLSSILQMLVYGFDYEEIVYKIRRGPESEDASQRSKFSDGKVGWRKWATRAQETRFKWVFDEAGGVKGLIQLAPPRYQLTFIPIEKALLFRTTARRGNPEGRSVLRGAYRGWYFKKRIEEIEAIGIERDLAGLPVAWVPPTMMGPNPSPDQLKSLNEMKRIVRNIRRDEQEGIVFPLSYTEGGQKMFDLTLLTTGGRRQFDTSAIITRYDQRIAMTTLADFILIGHEAVGSFALGSAKIDLFAGAVKAFLDIIAETINQHAIPRLFKLNGEKLADDPPRLVPGQVQQVDLESLGKFVTSLAQAGAPLFPDDDLEDYLRATAGMPNVDREARAADLADARQEASRIAALAAAMRQAPGDPSQGMGGVQPETGTKPLPTGQDAGARPAVPLQEPKGGPSGKYRTAGAEDKPTPTASE